MIRPVIVITHAAFDDARCMARVRLVASLETEAPGIPVHVVEDHDRRGSLWCWHRAMCLGLETDATHIVWLPDDAILCKGFGAALLAAIEARPDDVFDCASDDSRMALGLSDGWVSTQDGFCGNGGVFPRHALEEHLEWRARSLEPDVANDLGVNMWAMATGRLIYKTAPSLCDHDASMPSLDGNDADGERKSTLMAKDGGRLYFGKDAKHLGRTRERNHFETVFRSFPSSWNLENIYRAHRNGAPLTKGLHVFIAVPAYQAPEPAMRASLRATLADLKEHGIASSILETPGDSLVTRGRHVLVHEFLCSAATHLLQWDADVECQDPTAVRKMLETGLDIVGGAYPFRDGSGHVVANILDEDMAEQKVCLDEDRGTIRVREVGTGFLMTSRKCLVDLQQRHPELMYMSDLFTHPGAPMWALFDVALEVGQDGRKRYASEDWHFCSLARAAGYEVHVYAPPKFRHWGKKGHEGHVLHAWGIVPKEAPL